MYIYSYQWTSIPLNQRGKQDEAVAAACVCVCVCVDLRIQMCIHRYEVYTHVPVCGLFQVHAQPGYWQVTSSWTWITAS